jgi:hypothetical protein
VAVGGIGNHGAAVGSGATGEEEIGAGMACGEVQAKAHQQKEGEKRFLHIYNYFSRYVPMILQRYTFFSTKKFSCFAIHKKVVSLQLQKKEKTWN